MPGLLSFIAASALAAPAPEAGLDLMRLDAPIVVDGSLDDAGWAHTTPITRFQRFRPTPGGAHESQTEVRVVQDHKHLYIGVRVTGTSHPPVARIAPREDINNDDQIGIYIDPFHDGRGGYIFYFNAHGIQQDARFAFGQWYPAWNTVLFAEGALQEDGYTLEVAIPFRSLRYPDVEGSRGAASQTWGFMVTRKIPDEGIKLSWPELQPRHPRLFAQAAPLRGVQPPEQGTGLELQPVLAANHQMTRETPDAPLNWTGEDLPWTDSVRPGLDARWAITPDLGLATTVNPDFSQVEGDIQQINLNQRFAFFYPEQRPFFLNGLEAYTDTTETLYTRSVVDPLYGVKLSGRQGALGLGFLHALDQSPQATIHELGSPGFEEAEVTDRVAATTFARTRFDVVDNGYIGLSVADKRMVEAPEFLGPTDGSAPPPTTSGYNDLAIADAQVPIGETWTITAFAGGSVSGNQTDTIQGFSEGITVRRSPPLGTGGRISLDDRTEGFRNEVGFLTQSGITNGLGDLFHRFQLGDGRSTYTPMVSSEFFEERDGDAQTALATSHELNLRGIHRPELTTEIRRYEQAGVRMQGWSSELEYAGRINNALSVRSSASTGRELDFGLLVPATSHRGNVDLIVRPTTRLRVDAFYVRQWYQPDGEALTRASRIYTRMNYQLNRAWGMRMVGATTRGDDLEAEPVFASFLLTWLQSPGTEAYLGATWNSSRNNLRPDEDGLQEQVIFAKFSKLFRL